MKRLVVWVLLAALVCAWGAPALAGDKETLVYSWGSNVGDLNPHMYSPSQMFAQAMVYEPLVRYGEGGKIEPCLAEKWEVSEDGKTYTFFLRKGVTFTDGTPWNAEAAKKNIDAVMLNAHKHDWLGLIGQIEGAEAVDEFTLKLNLKNAYYPILQELSLIRPIRFLSPAAFPESGNTAEGIKKAVGTGPWILTETKKGEYDLFVRNDNYWGEKPAFAKVLVKVIPDSEARVVALETGEIDLIFGASGHGSAQIGLESFKRLEATGQFDTGVSGPSATQAIAINSAKGPTADLAVRKALQYAVDKDAIIKAVFLDVEKRADFYFDPQVPYCNVGLEPYAYDVAKAEKLLDEAGWKTAEGSQFRSKDGQELVIDLCFVGNSPLQKAVAEALQGMLQKVGIRLNLIGEESDSFYKRQQDGEFGMIFNDTWGAPYEPHAMVSSMRVPSHADYQAQIGLPMKKELDEKIGAVLLTTDEKARQELYRDILTIIHEQAVYLPLTYKTLVKASAKDLAGVDFTPFMNYVPFEGMSRK